jgi:hypothetical protein
MIRIALAIVGLVSTIFFLPLVTFICAIVLSIRYRAWEVIIMGALLDLVWSPYDVSWHTIPIYTLIALALVWGLEPLRAQFLLKE